MTRYAAINTTKVAAVATTGGATSRARANHAVSLYGIFNFGSTGTQSTGSAMNCSLRHSGHVICGGKHSLVLASCCSIEKERSDLDMGLGDMALGDMASGPHTGIALGVSTITMVWIPIFIRMLRTNERTHVMVVMVFGFVLSACSS